MPINYKIIMIKFIKWIFLYFFIKRENLRMEKLFNEFEFIVEENYKSDKNAEINKVKNQKYLAKFQKAKRYRKAPIENKL